MNEHVDWRKVALPVDADREREQPVMSFLPVSAVGPIGELMGAAARLLREVEDGGDSDAAAQGLRETFDKWLPGWDSGEAGFDLN